MSLTPRVIKIGSRFVITTVRFVVACKGCHPPCEPVPAIRLQNALPASGGNNRLYGDNKALR